MKINEKNLASFANSKGHVDKEGYLLKRGEVNRNFYRRWFFLKGNLLFYMERKTDREPLGLIILEGCTVELEETEEAYSFKLVFHGATGSHSRHYVFCAESQDSMEEWMKALSCASYDYMKLLVAELQRQLDEILETERQTVTENSAPAPVPTRPIVPQQRFNPFDGAPSTSASRSPQGDHSILETVSVSANFTHKYSFHELHEYYGYTFRQLFKQWKKEDTLLPSSGSLKSN